MSLPHSCRYCSYCMLCDEGYWCDEKEELVGNIGRVNKCAKWLGNEIKADGKDWNDTYKPRVVKVSPYTQDKLFEMPTDKQKGKAK